MKCSAKSSHLLTFFSENFRKISQSKFLPISSPSVDLRFVLEKIGNKNLRKTEEKKREKIFNETNNKRRQLSLPKNGIKLSL